MDTSYKGLNRNFCREAQGVIMVADITNLQSIDDTAQWKQEVDDILSAQGAPIPIVLCVNKVDRIENIDEANLDYLQTEDGIREFAQQHEFFETYRTSAKEDINISTAFSVLTREMIIAAIAKSQEEEQKTDYEAEEGRLRGDSFNLDGRQQRRPGNGGCKC